MAQNQKNQKLEPLPVKRLTVDDKKSLDVRGAGHYSSKNVFTTGNGITIEYHPWMRHHCIRGEGVTLYVPESWCTWEPA